MLARMPVLPSTVLIVDDAEFDRQLASDIVRSAGLEPMTASSSAEALAILAEHRPLLVLMDLFMPGEPGDVCSRIIRGNEELADLPILMMTSSRADAEIRRALMGGVDDFIAKPLVEGQLLAKLTAIRAGLGRPGPLPRVATSSTLLLADDDALTRTIVGKVLESAGFKVLEAETGLEALQILHRARPLPDVLVLDLFMPGMGGAELIRRIRETPTWAHLPIMVVSGVRHDAAIQQELARLGVSDLVEKDEAALESIAKRASALVFRGDEIRRGRRIDFFRCCEFRRRPDEGWMTGFTTNLGPNGVFIRTLTSAPADSVIDFRFELTGRRSMVITKATVVWSQELEPRAGRPAPGMGLRFLDLGEDARRDLELVVSQGQR